MKRQQKWNVRHQIVHHKIGVCFAYFGGCMNCLRTRKYIETFKQHSSNALNGGKSLKHLRCCCENMRILKRIFRIVSIWSTITQMWRRKRKKMRVSIRKKIWLYRRKPLKRPQHSTITHLICMRALGFVNALTYASNAGRLRIFFSYKNVY